MKGKPQKQQSKASKGSVGVESFKGKLRLNLPRQWFGGTQKRFALGLDDTPENRKQAELKARQIERDYALDNFDPTLVKYKPKSYLTSVTAITAPIPTVVELYQRYVDYKAQNGKKSTDGERRQFIALFNKLPKMLITDALEVQQALMKATTPDRTKRALMKLSAACSWGMEHGLVTSNPYARLAKDMGKFNYQKTKGGNAFSSDEMEAVIEAFKTDDRKGINYRHYAPFVEFLFLTGCRTGEAVGLRWEHVDLERRLILFRGSVTQSGDGKSKWSEGSKNNKERDFPYGERLHLLLTSLVEKNGFVPRPDSLVFPSPKGEWINLANFGKRAWNAVVDPIKPNTEPYDCRATFITTQLAKGHSADTIARWCDNSASEINRSYEDASKLTHLRPSD